MPKDTTTVCTCMHLMHMWEHMHLMYMWEPGFEPCLLLAFRSWDDPLYCSSARPRACFEGAFFSQRVTKYPFKASAFNKNTKPYQRTKEEKRNK